MITEDQLEQRAISWFQDTGWCYVHGPNIPPVGPAPGRASYNEVVLSGRLPLLKYKRPPDCQDDADAPVIAGGCAVGRAGMKESGTIEPCLENTRTQMP